MGRIVHVAPARPGGAAHWAKLAAAVLLACAVGVGLTRIGDDKPSAGASAAQTLPGADPPTVVAIHAAATVPAAAAPAPALATCPIQSLQLSLDRAPVRTVCMDATLLQQNGSVRSYVLRAADAEGWALRVDMVERAVQSVSLQARDGRKFGCEAPNCAGEAAVVTQRTGGSGHLALRDLRLARMMPPGPQTGAGSGEMVVNAELRVPPDDQVPGLACTGPSATLSAANGSSRKLCGQGGAGVEIADDGQRHYRFQDHEGRTLAITVNAEQRIVGVTWDELSCRGNACRGASTSSADPANDLAERSFFFGRTALFDQTTAAGTGAAARPALVLDGTLVMPAQ